MTPDPYPIVRDRAVADANELRQHVAELRLALREMLFHFDKPKRDEYLTASGWQAACDACDMAHTVLERTK